MNTTNFLVFIISLFLVESLVAQTRVSGNGLSAKSDTISKEIVDNAKYRVYYALLFAKDSTMPDKKTECRTILLIGSKVSCFLDYNSLRKDSLYDALIRRNENQVSIISQAISLGRMVKFKPLILKNHPKSNSCLFQQTVASSHYYEYTDKGIDIKWTLSDEEKAISGYTCTKATCSY
jgi:GLPGLI family protein